MMRILGLRGCYRKLHNQKRAITREKALVPKTIKIQFYSQQNEGGYLRKFSYLMRFENVLYMVEIQETYNIPIKCGHPETYSCKQEGTVEAVLKET
jgi:hypothetical protein